ncbi:MAG: DUF401 family protein [Candidatus Bipolaricaulota bacterium]|nr:MAG: DUF401 family protein [Candidatus Bipolaricaulota bacterium]
MLLWVGFALAMVLLLAVSRRDLAAGMAVASVVLAAFTLDGRAALDALRITFSDPAVWLLAFVVGLIPMIGGVMEISGQMARLVANLRMGIRPFLATAPALLGMLPMPGGTLLSAPMIERGAGHMDSDLKAAANVWFRHTFLPIYPLGAALIASAKIASLTVYQVIPALAPAFLLMLVLGYLFLLRRADGRLTHAGSFSLRGLLVPLAVILAAPGLDVLLKLVLALPYAEIGTAAGVIVSLLLAIRIGRVRSREVGAVFLRMRPWKYALIILAMFAFLNVFKSSGAPEAIAALHLPVVLLMVVIGFLLGVITGRVQAPMSILVPIYLTTHAGMTPAVFAVAYFAVFLGFLVSPIHPCVSVSLQYFGTPLTAFLRRMALPVAVAVAVTLGVGLLVL